MRRGYDEGDGWRTAAGAGQIALGALPGAGVTRAGRALVNQLFASAPRAMATTAGLGAVTLPSAYADDAKSATDKASTAVEADQTVQRLRDQLKKARDNYAKANDPKTNYPSTTSRQMAVKPFSDEIEQLQGRAGIGVGLLQGIRIVERLARIFKRDSVLAQIADCLRIVPFKTIIAHYTGYQCFGEFASGPIWTLRSGLPQRHHVGARRPEAVGFPRRHQVAAAF